MKLRILTAFALCAAAATSLGACESDHYYYAPYPDPCGQFTSCGSCTPVRGCGWCSFDGGGVCLSDPYLCGEDPFRWNWDPRYCPAAPTEPDGGAPAPTSDGGNASEAGPPSPDAALAR